MVMVFLGAPGSGKGTQSSRLSSQLNIPRLSTGEMLRSEAKQNSPAGLRLRRLLASGALLSDRLMCDVVAERLRREIHSAGYVDAGLILDGFPRTVQQAAFLDNLLAELGLPRPTVVHLQVSESCLLRRLNARRQCANCGAVYNLLSRPSLRGSRCENDGGLLKERDDDKRAVILKRLADFEESFQSLRHYYAETDCHYVDGDRDPDLIAAELMEIAMLEEISVSASSQAWA